MDVKVFDGEADHQYVLMFYIEDGELKHIVPSDPNQKNYQRENALNEA